MFYTPFSLRRVGIEISEFMENRDGSVSCIYICMRMGVALPIHVNREIPLFSNDFENGIPSISIHSLLEDDPLLFDSVTPSAFAELLLIGVLVARI